MEEGPKPPLMGLLPFVLITWMEKASSAENVLEAHLNLWGKYSHWDLSKNMYGQSNLYL